MGVIMERFELEVCIDSVESALAAQAGGATRLEVCENLIIGGTTPGPWLFDEIRKRCDIKMNIMIRPRHGDFYYTDYEFAIMKNAVRWYRGQGADGIVIGILKADGSLDTQRMKELMNEAGDMAVTLHRAFDVCRDPYEAMSDAVNLGIDTILTSGQKNVSAEGTKLLKSLVKKSSGKINIMVGSGVSHLVIEDLYKKTGATTYHMSGKRTLESQMDYRKEDVSMGHYTITEYGLGRTDMECVKKAREILESL